MLINQNNDLLTITELFSYDSSYGGGKRYFKATHTDNKTILFSFREWASEAPKTLDEITEAYKVAKIPSYQADHINFNYPLNIFAMSIFTFAVEFQANNMSLYEYERLIKNNHEAHNALKCAFIQHEENSDTLNIVCESYDEDSHTTKDNISIVNRHWYSVKNELMQLLNKSDEYIEALY